MVHNLLLATFVFLVCCIPDATCQSISIDQQSAEVWYHEQKISGVLHDFNTREIVINHNGNRKKLHITSPSFSFSLSLENGNNDIWVEANSGHSRIESKRINYILKYKPLPEVMPAMEIRGDIAFLHATVVENPRNATLAFSWSAKENNPAAVTMQKSDNGASVYIPEKAGKYYFDLLVIAGKDSVTFSTFCERVGKQLVAFKFDDLSRGWAKDAVIYQVTPYKFVDGGTFADISAKIPELHALGINTLWLQPVFGAYQRGQGYDVTDYFSVNRRLGSEDDLRALIQAAKSRGMRVIFDMVPNHTSIYHPYAKACMQQGVPSHYYPYYQHQFDGVPYASFYNKDHSGFVYYFWKELVNLNYRNKEVQQWMLEACKYWVREFGIDGYRFDAVWGVNAREPQFMKRLIRQLRSIDPELLLIAEDKPSPSVYEAGFDAAYDWTGDTTWVSQWSWQYKYDESRSFTLFNHPDVARRVRLLSKALFPTDSPSFRLRFMENNDIARFIKDHSKSQTKMVAALLFSLDGIPMLYNGQEIGLTAHPYKGAPFFERQKTIQELDTMGMFAYYQKLISLRKSSTALRGRLLKQVYATDDGILAFVRSDGNEDVHVVVNLSNELHNIRPADLKPDAKVFADMLTGERFKEHEYIALPAYSVRWLSGKR